MPRYEYECPDCLSRFEIDKPLSECDAPEYCSHCWGRYGVEITMTKLFAKLTTVWKGKDRKWGTSLYRKHDKGEKVRASKAPAFSPLLRKGEIK